MAVLGKCFDNIIPQCAVFMEVDCSTHLLLMANRQKHFSFRDERINYLIKEGRHEDHEIHFGLQLRGVCLDRCSFAFIDNFVNSQWRCKILCNFQMWRSLWSFEILWFHVHPRFC